MVTVNRRQFFCAGLAGLVGLVATSGLAWAVPKQTKQWAAADYLRQIWLNSVKANQRDFGLKGIAACPKRIWAAPALYDAFEAEMQVLHRKLKGSLAAEMIGTWVDSEKPDEKFLMFKAARLYRGDYLKDWDVAIALN